MTGFVNLKKNRIVQDKQDETKLLEILKREEGGMKVNNLRTVLTGIQGFTPKGTV